MGASLSPLCAQRILELSLGCIGHLHGPAEESRGWGLWDPHNPPRLWDRPGSAWAGPAACQNHPALGCLTPSCLLLQLRPGGLVPTSSEGFVRIPDQEASWTHCGCRSWIYWWILIQGCTQVPGDLCPPPARWPWQGNPQPSPGVPGVLIYQTHLQALVGMR